MSFSAFDVYNAILAIVSFQIARGRGQQKCHFNARVFRATYVITEDSDLSGATGGNVCFQIRRFLQNIRSSMHALGLLMHKDA